MPRAAQLAVNAVDLAKRFAEHEAVRGISFAIAAGECLGLLGQNGAGKSSTMRLIGCVSPRTSGRLEVLGMDAATHGRAIKARLGTVPQDDNLDPYLSGRDNLHLFGRYFGLSGAALQQRAGELLDFVRLGSRGADLVHTLSGGMRRRLLIARALINRPELILLDEPTAGLDPQARHLLWERLRELRGQGGTLLLSTHYMEEAEQLCDRVIIMDAGRIVGEGAPEALIRRHASGTVVEVVAPEPVRHAAAQRLQAQGLELQILADHLLLFVDAAEPHLAALQADVGAHGRIVVRRGGLEDVFLKLTGQRSAEAS